MAGEPLDAYSEIVAGVAAELTGKVASLVVPRSGSGGGRWPYGGESLGSAVVFTGDGFLLTNAHVVGDATAGSASFGDGSTLPFRVVCADPLSDLAVVRCAGDRVKRAYLGLVTAPAPVPAAFRERLGRANGLRAAEVVAGGPADRAGLRAGDLLITAGGHPVASAQDLQRLMFAEAIGRPLAITVMRNGALVDVIAQPAELVAA